MLEFHVICNLFPKKMEFWDKILLDGTFFHLNMLLEHLWIAFLIKLIWNIIKIYSIFYGERKNVNLC
jgi:hypothetical protein